MATTADVKTALTKTATAAPKRKRAHRTVTMI